MTPAADNGAWTEFNRIVTDPNRHGVSITRKVKVNGDFHGVARRKTDNMWWIVNLSTDDAQPPCTHGPFDTAEVAWSTLRLLGS
jgi:hypothetical protein